MIDGQPNNSELPTLARGGRLALHRRTYCWVVCACTCLILALLVWPLSVSRFESTAYLSLRYSPSESGGPDALKQTVRAVVQDALDPAVLERLRGEVLLENVSASRVLRSGDTQLLRDAIFIRFAEGAMPHTIRLSVTVAGSGTPDETALANRLASYIASHVPVQAAMHQWSPEVEQLAAYLQQQSEIARRENTEALRLMMAGLDGIRRDVRMVTRLAEAWEQDRTRNDSVGQTPNATWLQLKAQHDQLVREKQQLQTQRQWTDHHPDVRKLQSRIDTVAAELNATSPTVDEKQGSGALAHTASLPNAVRTENRFVQASSQRVLNPPTAQIVGELSTIDVETPRSLVNNWVEATTAQTATTYEQLQTKLQRLLSTTRATNRVTIDLIQPARQSRPVGGVPSLVQLAMLAAFSISLASIVAWHYNPACRRRVFGSVAKVSQRLDMPVIAEIPQSKEARRPIKLTGPNHAAAWALRGCEWFLAAIACVVLLAILLNSLVLADLFEAPLDAVTRIVWMIAPRF